RHVRDDPYVLRSGDLADVLLDLGGDLLRDLLAGLVTGLERDVHLDHLAAGLVDHRNRGGLGDLLDLNRGRLELLGPQPLPGDIGCTPGSVLPRKPPVSVIHQVSVIAALPLPTTSWYHRQTSGSIGSPTVVIVLKW